jgi:precorrin-2/cobalt-factor-2 C20-methyltransferase
VSGRPGGRLSGVGVGPGDPELVTVKAVRVLRAAERVFVPVGAGASGPGYAEQVVLAHTDAGRVTRLAFALGDDPAARERSWEAAAAAVAAVVGAGGHAAFATIGDPNLYSTFTYLARTVRARVPTVGIETVPGITALQDLAARSGTVLAEGDQTLALLPFTAGPERLRAALDEHDTVVVYKGGRLLPEVRRALETAGRAGRAVFGARLGLSGERLGLLPDGPAPYLSTIVVTRSPGAPEPRP